MRNKRVRNEEFESMKSEELGMRNGKSKP